MSTTPALEEPRSLTGQGRRFVYNVCAIFLQFVSFLAIYRQFSFYICYLVDLFLVRGQSLFCEITNISCNWMRLEQALMH